jgi:hypothetical protein
MVNLKLNQSSVGATADFIRARKRGCELLRTDSAFHQGHIVVMTKKKQDRIEHARKIVASVKKEMQLPRLTESVRRSGEEKVASLLGLRTPGMPGAYHKEYPKSCCNRKRGHPSDRPKATGL